MTNDDDTPRIYDPATATEEDFRSADLFAYIFQIEDRFQRKMTLTKFADRAKELKVTGFRDLYNAFEKSVEESSQTTDTVKQQGLTNFTGQPIQLATSWKATDEGIYKGEEVACMHPILITKRINNIDTHRQRVEISYRLGKKWRKITCSKSDIMTRQAIVKLSDFGVSVSSETAGLMVEYLQELDQLNYQAIPTVEATSKLGWTSTGEFMPYSEKVEFDGDMAVARLFNAVHTKGSYSIWLETIQSAMRRSKYARIAVTASMLSPILPLINALPSFVHFWSPKSSTGKTVLLMLATSFWADPEQGRYMQSFNATSVAMERMAGVLNNCPYMIDELQLGAKWNGRSTFNVYQLAQGEGKGRGNQAGGIDDTPTWRNTILTSGESSILKDSDGEGAMARVLDVRMDEPFVDSSQGNQLATRLKNNYGFGGEILVDALIGYGRDRLIERFNEILNEINSSKTIQDKQSILGAGMMLAAELGEMFIFDGDELTTLTMDELLPHLLTKEQTSIQERAYEYATGWVASNWSKFDEDALEIFGTIDGDHVYIIRSIFNDAMEREGYSPKSVLADFAEAGLIETGNERDTTRHDVRKRIKGSQVRCVAMRLERSKSRNDEVSFMPYNL